MSFCNNSGGIVGINKDSRISNCALIPESFEGAMMCVGGIAGQNISTESDAIIENCFVSTEYVSSYSTSYAGGIVGKNITENEGEITNSTLFNEELLLEENIEVNGEGIGELLEALNKWVENSQGQYNSWCVLEDENYGYPILEFMAKDFANTEELTINNMVIYPNPAHEYIKIESEKKSEIKVYSVNGQIVLKRNINEGVSTIDISNLNSGMYFIDVDGNISKFVVR